MSGSSSYQWYLLSLLCVQLSRSHIALYKEQRPFNQFIPPWISISSSLCKIRTIYSLYDKYNSIGSEIEKENLLKDIIARFQKKKTGKQMSSFIYHLLTDSHYTPPHWAILYLICSISFFSVRYCAFSSCIAMYSL